MRRKNITTEMMKDYISQALFLLLKKKGFAEISIGEIAIKAGVNRSTYYRNFNSKEDIVRFYCSKVLGEYNLAYDNDLTFQEYMRGLYEHWLNYKTELILIHKNNLFHLILDELNNFFIPPDQMNNITLEYHYKMFWYTGAIYNIFSLWVLRNMKDTPEQMGEILVRIIPNNLDQEFIREPFLFHI
jgi:AcrR family transcriptional regulator